MLRCADVAAQQVKLPRLRFKQQQQQGTRAGSFTACYTLLSCFRELPSVSTAPPPMAISIQRQQSIQQLQQQQQDQLPFCLSGGPSAAPSAPATGPSGSTTSDNSSSSSNSTSLGDIPQQVIYQLLSLLTSRDLAALALTCRYLCGLDWDAAALWDVPGTQQH